MAEWYFGHIDELLLDFDDFEKPTAKGGVWGEDFFRLRLQPAMEAEKIDVREVWLVPSNTSRHKHVIVRLNHPYPSLWLRLVWQLHLGSDIYRAKADLMRAAKGNLFPTLLIQKTPIVDPTTGEPFYRPPDAHCDCTKKHDTEEQFKLGADACKVWQQYRGAAPWELWGPPNKPQTRVRLRDGKVPLEYIRAQIPKVRGRQPEDSEVRRAWAINRAIASSSPQRSKKRGAAS